jgi:capsular polysaccharide biosynthesis protein
VLGTMLMGCYAFFLSTPVYQATSKLYIMNQDGLSLDMADLNIGSALTMDYQEVFKTWEVHEMVRGMLSLDYSYKEMQDMLTVSNPNDTRLLYITVKHTDPQIATSLANAYATAAKTFIYQTMETAEPNEFSIALVPSTAMGMSKARYMMAGFLAGMVLSLGVLAVQFIADDAPHTPEDISRTAGISVLAVVPREVGKDKNGSKRSRRARKEERE